MTPTEPSSAPVATTRGPKALVVLGVVSLLVCLFAWFGLWLLSGFFLCNQYGYGFGQCSGIRNLNRGLSVTWVWVMAVFMALAVGLICILIWRKLVIGLVAFAITLVPAAFISGAATTQTVTGCPTKLMTYIPPCGPIPTDPVHVPASTTIELEGLGSITFDVPEQDQLHLSMQYPANMTPSQPASLFDPTIHQWLPTQTLPGQYIFDVSNPAPGTWNLDLTPMNLPEGTTVTFNAH